MSTPTRAGSTRTRAGSTRLSVTARAVVASQVEPRLDERRRTVQRAARRRRRRVFIGLGAVVALIAGVVGATLSPLLDVDRITVVGSEHVSEAELIAASGVEHGDRLLDLDANEARSAIMAIPWVASARVVRDWPDAVRLSVTEERPVASLVAGESVVLVSSTGRVLEQLAGPDPSLPQMLADGPLELEPDSGTPDAEPIGGVVSDRLRTALSVFGRMSADLVPELSLATVADDGTISFELPDGAVVQFGPPEDVAAKLLSVQSVLSQVVRDCMAVLDVREPSPATVSRGPGCPGISPVGSSRPTDATDAAGDDAGSDAEAGDR